LRNFARSMVVGNTQIGIGGDLIIAADGHAIENNETLPRLMARKRGGDPLELTINRGGRIEKVKVTLDEEPQQF
jgi:S1-C subfamily serine protease